MLYIYAYTLSLLCGRVCHSNTDDHYMDEISTMHIVVKHLSSKQAQNCFVNHLFEQSCHLHLLCHDITVTSWNEFTYKLVLPALLLQVTHTLDTHTHSVNVPVLVVPPPTHTSLTVLLG